MARGSERPRCGRPRALRERRGRAPPVAPGTPLRDHGSNAKARQREARRSIPERSPRRRLPRRDVQPRRCGVQQ
ncbi:Hypothetical protein CAP_6853 [Chondromyces apiculatus DSM 436]|uniref:Uncharacterized protein n=1 Tax=Chondromyces apiculatus DSM 436 TaxID=1192034 RepID=A0A017TGT7_9BACT|nr:Hypothetical protein CAP_6853 [Chondromyces apiculatus DSM 436]